MDLSLVKVPELYEPPLHRAQGIDQPMPLHVAVQWLVDNERLVFDLLFHHSDPKIQIIIKNYYDSDIDEVPEIRKLELLRECYDKLIKAKEQPPYLPCGHENHDRYMLSILTALVSTE